MTSFSSTSIPYAARKSVSQNAPWAVRQLGTRPRLPFPGFSRCTSAEPFMIDQNLRFDSDEDINHVLAVISGQHPDILESFLVKNYSLNDLQKILVKKKKSLSHFRPGAFEKLTAQNEQAKFQVKTGEHSQVRNILQLEEDNFIFHLCVN